MTAKVKKYEIYEVCEAGWMTYGPYPTKSAAIMAAKSMASDAYRDVNFFLVENGEQSPDILCSGKLDREEYGAMFGEDGEENG